MKNGMRWMMASVLVVSTAASACTRAQADGAIQPLASAATPPSEAPSAATPDWRDVTIPAGTRLSIVLDTGVGSDTSRIEEPVLAHLSQPLSLGGRTVLAQGTRVSGVVTDATRSAKVKGRAHVAIRFDTLRPAGDDERYSIRTTPVGRMAAGTKKKDALEIAGPAGAGAVIGALFGGKKGAAIGTAIGGGAGTAVVLSTRGHEVHLPQGARLTLRLSQPVTIRVRS